MQVRKIMTPDVQVGAPDTTLKAAAAKMKVKDVGGAAGL